MHPTLKVVDELAAIGWIREKEYTPKGAAQRYEDSWRMSLTPGWEMYLDRWPHDYSLWFVHIRENTVYYKPGTEILAEGFPCPLAASVYLSLEGDGNVVDGALKLWVDLQRKRGRLTTNSSDLG